MQTLNGSSMALRSINIRASGRVNRMIVRAAARPLDATVGSADAVARRQALMLLGLGSVLGSGMPAYAGGPPTVCADQETGEEADECRARVLQRDAGKQEDYSRYENRTARTAVNVPVSTIDDEYARATLTLAGNLEDYFTIDVYDKRRIPLIKEIKAEAQSWVTKYARGGSVRKQSARRFYVAVDAVLGHLASNGLAPLPASKAKVVRATIEEAKELLADSK